MCETASDYTVGCCLGIRLANRVTELEFCSRTALFSGNCAVVHLYRELDACSATYLRARLAPVAMTGPGVIVDLAGLRFVDITGLIARVDLKRDAATTGGSLRLSEQPRPVRRLLKPRSGETNAAGAFRTSGPVRLRRRFPTMNE
jgi:anti-anti-sigma factor